MQVELKQGKLENFNSELLAVGVFENAPLNGAAKELDKILSGKIVRHVKDERFEGKEGEALVVDTEEKKIPARLVLVLGLGKQKNFNLETIRRTAAISVKKAEELKIKNIASAIYGAGVEKIPVDLAGQAMTEGALLGHYKFLKFKSEEARKKISAVENFTIVEADRLKFKKELKGLEKGLLYGEAAILARDLVNEPSSYTTPKMLSQLALTMVKQCPSLKVQVFGKAELETMGARAFLAVARGSDEEPFLVHFVYKPTKKNKKLKKICLVGKGLTFDAGGLSLKPANSMTTMKLDMSGAAAVFGVFSALEKLKINAEVHGVVPLCENMPSGKAVKPGDVVKSMSGKTIEILNTDAEGRVVLADALTYAQKLKPDLMIDLATLTGACIVALGEDVAGLMSNNQKLAEKIKVAAQEAGEFFWELPLVPEYKQFMKSNVADLANTHSGARWGDAIFGGLFLQEFVGETPWAHLDIAGPAFAEQDIISYMPKGGTGFGVRTILNFLENL
ncbi:MAG: leucyl aminopeptidase [bacterium]|nr:leucyl aminopeptidase [bacterium]